MDAGLTLSILVLKLEYRGLNLEKTDFRLTTTASIRASKKLNEITIMSAGEIMEAGFEFVKPVWRRGSGRIII